MRRILVFLPIAVLLLPGSGEAAALAGGSTASAQASAARATARFGFPVGVSPNRRYLVDQRGRPFMIVGDSPQALIVKVSVSDAKRFLANRRAAGFNAVWVNLLCNNGTGGRTDGATYDGVVPFRRPGDLSTPNEAYFRRVDAVVASAAKNGITVFLDPIETIGWTEILSENGAARAFEYGRYLGRRYAKYPNIVWMSGNDFIGWRDVFADTAALAVARGIQAEDKTHIHTVELEPPLSASFDDVRWVPLIELDAAYTYRPTYAQVLREYNRANHVPTFMVEANYEFENDYKNLGTLRRQEYWAMLSGAAGHFYGNKFTWQFIPGWKSRINTKGVAELKYVTEFFASRPWYRLVPDQEHSLVIDGYGTFSDSGSVNSNDYVTAARTPDGKLAVAYLPIIRAVKVDLRTFPAPVVAQWYDPTTAKYSRIAGSPFPNSQPQVFTPPGKNHAGSGDWVLVMTAFGA